MASVSEPMNAEQQAQRDSHGVDQAFELAEYHRAHGALIARRTVVQARHGVAHLAQALLAEFRIYRRPHEIGGVLEVAVKRTGLVGNEDALVVGCVVIGHLRFGPQHADHGEAQAVDGDLFANGRHLTEELSRRVGAQHGDALFLDFILRHNPTSGCHGLVAHPPVLRMYAAHGDRLLAIAVDHGAAAHHHFGRNRRDHRGGFAYGLDVGALQLDASSGAFPARLRGCAAAEDQHEVLSLRTERLQHGAVKAIAIPVQDHETRHAPCQADGGEDAALPVET